MRFLNVEVAYKKGGGYMFTENTEQDGRLMYLLAKKLNMFLGIYSVLNDTDLYTNIHTSNTNTTQEKLYKFRALEGKSGRDKSRKEEVQFSRLLPTNEAFLSLKKQHEVLRTFIGNILKRKLLVLNFFHCSLWCGSTFGFWVLPSLITPGTLCLLVKLP